MTARHTIFFLIILFVFVGFFGVAHAQSEDVFLIDSEPFYTWFDAKVANGLHNPVPFSYAEWLPSGHFVISGRCNTAISAPGFNPPGGVGSFEDSGMYVLTDDGTFVAKRNVCFDTSVRAPGCFEFRGCEAGGTTLPIGGSQFIRINQNNAVGEVFARSPVLYNVLSSSVSLLKKLFFNSWLFRDTFPPGQPESLVRDFRSIAVVNNFMIGQEERVNAFFGIVVYSLPNMFKVAEWPVTEGPTWPIVGVGNYLLAIHQDILFSSAGLGVVGVYRMPSESELLNGERPELVSEFSNRGFIAGYAHDAQDPNRIAIYWTGVGSGGARSHVNLISIYNATPSGLVLESELSIQPLTIVVEPGQHVLALSGEYLMYVVCGGGGVNRQCTLHVEKNGQALSVQPLSSNTAGINIPTIAVSDSGTILVSANGGNPLSVSNGAIYLYSIRDFAGPPPPPFQGGAFNVSLVTNQPIYDWKRIPYNSSFGYYPFHALDWVAGHFVVGGNCSAGAIGKTGVYPYNQGRLESAGMYVFRENGSLVGNGPRNVCYDTSAPPITCFEALGCTNSRKIQPVDEDTFIREMNPPGSGIKRSPVRYRITSSGVNRLERLFFNTGPYSFVGSGGITEFRSMVYANGVMVGIETRIVGPGNTHEVDNSYYAIPGMAKVASISEVTPPLPPGSSGGGGLTRPIFTPVAGIGELFITRDKAGTAKFSVYRMPSATELLSDAEPEFLHDLDFDFLIGFEYDSVNPERIAFMVAGEGNTTNAEMYEVNSSGLSLVSTTPLSGLDILRRVAFAGDYIAYGRCRFETPRDNRDLYRGCELVVMKDGIELSVEPFPKTPIDNIFGSPSGGVAPRLFSLAISPRGKIMVSLTTYGGGGGSDNGYIYLYEIENFDGTTTPPGTPPTTPPVGTSLSFNAYFDIISTYIRALQSIFNIGIPQSRIPDINSEEVIRAQSTFEDITSEIDALIERLSR